LNIAGIMAFALGEMGLRDADFWELTPYELHRRIVGWNRRQEAERVKVLYGSWHTAAMQRTKRMPALARLLKPLKTRRLNEEERAQKQREFEDRLARSGVKAYEGKGDVLRR
jgi:hypothetical protein